MDDRKVVDVVVVGVIATAVVVVAVMWEARNGFGVGRSTTLPEIFYLITVFNLNHYETNPCVVFIKQIYLIVSKILKKI